MIRCSGTSTLNSILELGLEVNEIRLIGGGATSLLWAQIITDNLQRDIMVPEGTDAAFGAALLAGVSAGIFNQTSQTIDNLIEIRTHLTPDEHNASVYNELFSIYKQSSEAIEDISHRLDTFQSS